jgi:uncharacterized repeat protein (TIGR01451 family)
MKNISTSQFLIVKLLVLSVAFFGANVFCYSQETIDLEVKIIPPSEAVHGGEIVVYTILVKNIGSTKAEHVVIVNEPLSTVDFISYSPSKGNCRLYAPSYTKNLYCSFGDIESGEVVSVVVEIRIAEFGDISITEENDSIKRVHEIFNRLGLEGNGESRTSQSSLGEVSARSYSKLEEIDLSNNDVELLVNLLPSFNIPPRVKILSPAYQLEITNSLKSPVEIPIEIEAFDPDGKIAKVEISGFAITPKGRIYENGQISYLVGAKTYSIRQMDEISKNQEMLGEFNGRFEENVEQTGSRSYTYRLKNPKFGLHRITVSVVDNGGRSSTVSTDFSVNGSSKIEIVRPKMKQIFSPTDEITFETVTKVTEGRIKKIYLELFDNFIGPDPVLKLISNEREIYRHKYIWTNRLPSASIYQTVNAVLIEESGEITVSEPIQFFVRELPKIRITSLENGQEISKRKEIEILFDKENDISDDDFYVFIDDVKIGEYSGGYIWRDAELGTHQIQIVAEFNDIELSRSEKITIKVK